MLHTTGVLVNTTTGDAVDAGVIFQTPEGIIVMHGDGVFNHYDRPENGGPVFAVLQFEFCPN